MRCRRRVVFPFLSRPLARRRPLNFSLWMFNEVHGHSFGVCVWLFVYVLAHRADVSISKPVSFIYIFIYFLSIWSSNKNWQRRQATFKATVRNPTITPGKTGLHTHKHTHTPSSEASASPLCNGTNSWKCCLHEWCCLNRSRVGKCLLLNMTE